MRRGQRLAGPLHDRVDRPGRQLDPEQLPSELGRVAARDTVADRERHDRRLQPRPERPPWHLREARPSSTAAHAGQQTQCSRCSLTLHRDRRQLGQLMPRRLRRVDAFPRAEHALTRPAAIGPMLDDLVDLLGRKQPPVPALVPGLPAALSTRARPARPRRRRRRILRRRQRRVPRTPTQPPLQLGDPSLEPLVRLHQPRVRSDQLIELQQQPDRRLAITIQDRLRLAPLHTQPFAAGDGVPSPPERLPFCCAGRRHRSACGKDFPCHDVRLRWCRSADGLRCTRWVSIHRSRRSGNTSPAARLQPGGCGARSNDAPSRPWTLRTHWHAIDRKPSPSRATAATAERPARARRMDRHRPGRVSSRPACAAAPPVPPLSGAVAS